MFIFLQIKKGVIIMRRTGENLQTIALIILMIGLFILFIMTISILSDSPSRLSTTIWVVAAIIGGNYTIFCLLLYGVGKIVEGIGCIRDDIHNIADINNPENEEILPNL